MYEVGQGFQLKFVYDVFVVFVYGVGGEVFEGGEFGVGVVYVEEGQEFVFVVVEDFVEGLVVLCGVVCDFMDKWGEEGEVLVEYVIEGGLDEVGVGVFIDVFV